MCSGTAACTLRSRGQQGTASRRAQRTRPSAGTRSSRGLRMRYLVRLVHFTTVLPLLLYSHILTLLCSHILTHSRSLSANRPINAGASESPQGQERTSQLLRMLSSVTLNCQATNTMVVIDLSSQLSKISTFSREFTSLVMSLGFC